MRATKEPPTSSSGRPWCGNGSASERRVAAAGIWASKAPGDGREYLRKLIDGRGRTGFALEGCSMVTLTVENYVKAIYQILAETGQPTASNGEIARKLGVAPGTVTSMLQTLDGANLVHYQTHKGASLTDAGRALALRVLRRH